MSKRLEPAKTVIERLGGPVRVSEICGVHESRPSHWMRPRDKKGTGGLIPAEYQQVLLDYAKAHGIDLKPADFFVGERNSIQLVA